MSPAAPVRLRANALLLLAALIWGSAFVGQVWGMDGLGPMSFSGARFALGAAVVAPLAWREWRQLRAQALAPPPAQAALAVLAMGGLLCTGMLMQQWGLQHTSVTHAGFLTALYVPLVPVLGWLLLRQRPHWSTWPAATACLAGSWLLAGWGPLATLNPGDAVIALSALPWALHVLAVGPVANRLRGAYVLASGQFAVAALLAGTLGLVFESPSWAGLQRAAGAVAYTGVLSIGVGFTLQVVGQRLAPPADAAIVLSSETLFAALFGAWLMGDRLGPGGWAGCALILAGMLLVQTLPLLPSRGR